ncbi:PilZ domain-containing protein [Maledivibacter halophilus]|uniref:PilZ domain-containing protein n=1 Tax=Maledivibacter halophilus TaxID=36842 RepID=A0A1T5IH80_9FIRM|nr:hypothetical protein [Maledivibacter halophilus]SKC38373.1 hypothetical protein SAMN02194393_00366 [Maledivibacter halophilus]
MSNNCGRQELKIQYLQRINIYNYYQNGKLINLKSPCEIIMLNISLEGLEMITNKEFQKGDILLLNLKYEGIPFDKILAKVIDAKKIGEMYKACLEFIGIPNFLFEKLNEVKKRL